MANDLRAEYTISQDGEDYKAKLTLDAIKNFETETNIGIMAFMQLCLTRQSKLADQAILIALAIKAANPNWGNNKVKKIMDEMTPFAHLRHALTLLDLALITPENKDGDQPKDEETKEGKDESPLH